MKKNIQLVQVNNSYGNQFFIPYSVGLLQSYCNKFSKIRDNFNFLKLVYKKQNDITAYVKTLHNIDILAQSCYVWNFQYNIAYAKEMKLAHPNTLIVFGGPQIPDDPKEFFEENPFVDILCHGEGEFSFHKLLLEYLETGNYRDIPGISYNDRDSKEIFHTSRATRPTDLEELPSPYLDDTFSELMQDDIIWQASWETNRGCPYRCSFCAWGAEYYNKIRKFSLENRLKEEIDWFSDNKIDLVFGCDANFGIFERDFEIAELLVEAKEKTGFPNKFRVCNAKNSNERVFRISKVFEDSNMAKGTSLSVQSMDEKTLEVIKRKNIGLDKFKDLLTRFNASEIPTYTEVILGLPGESIKSFIEGLDLLLHSGQHSQIHVYNCTVLNNTDMTEPTYVSENDIETIEVPIFRAHVDQTYNKEIEELENIIYKTSKMSKEDWKLGFKYSKNIQAFHTMGFLQYLSIFFVNNYNLTYSEFYLNLIEYSSKNPDTLLGQENKNVDDSITKIFNKEPYGQIIPNYDLPIVWPVEEGCVLRVIDDINMFYEEVELFFTWLLEKFELPIDKDLISEVIKFQKLATVTYMQTASSIELNYNLVDYIGDIKNGLPTEISKFSEAKTYKITKVFTDIGNKTKFAREVIWFGRKGGSYLNSFNEIE